MVTNTQVVVCPKCRVVNSYKIEKLSLVDIDLHASYSCESCGSEYTNIYALVYIGGNCGSMVYDRDNIISR